MALEVLQCPAHRRLMASQSGTQQCQRGQCGPPAVAVQVGFLAAKMPGLIKLFHVFWAYFKTHAVEGLKDNLVGVF